MSQRPGQTLKSLRAPAGMAERPCSKCRTQLRQVGLSWCRQCENEAKRERKRRRQQEMRDAEADANR